MDSIGDFSTKLDVLMKHESERDARHTASWRIITVLASIGVFTAGIMTWGISEYLRYYTDIQSGSGQQVIIERAIEQYENQKQQ